MLRNNDFIKIKDEFQYAINLKYDLDSESKIENYIMTPGAVEVIEDIALSFSSNSTDRSRILVGPYGKGKSHLLLVITSLIRDLGSDHAEKVLYGINKFNSRLYDHFRDLEKSKFRLLPIIVSSSSLDMKQILLTSLMESLRMNNLESIMPETYYSSAIKTIEMWKTDYENTYESFLELLGVDIDIYIQSLRDFDRDSFDAFEIMFSKVTSGAKFNPLVHSEIDSIYSDASKALKEYGYNGIYIIYDEFSKFLEGSINTSSALDIKLLQDMAELCNRSGDNQIHLTLISHKGIISYTDSLPKEKVDSWKAVDKRFKRIELSNSKTQLFHLISNVIKKDDNLFNDYRNINNSNFKELTLNLVKTGILRNSGIDYDNFIDMTYPLHPISTILLPEVSEKIAQNERTIFTFLSANEKSSLPYVIENNNVDLITPEIIYDYFESLFKKENYSSDIYRIWRSVKDVLHKIDVFESYETSIRLLGAKIVKLIALINVSEYQEIAKPNSMLFDFVFGWDYSYDDIEKGIAFLTDNNFIRYIESKMCYELKSVSSTDITKKITEEAIRRSPLINSTNVLKKNIDTKVIYPLKYNDDYQVIRYFEIEPISSDDFCEKASIKYNEYSGTNGLFLLVLNENDKTYDELIKVASTIKNPLVVVAIPKECVSYKDFVSKYEAIDFLYHKNKIEDNDHLIEEELLLNQTDIKNLIVEFEEKYLNPVMDYYNYTNQGVSVSFARKSTMNNFLSEIMSKQYSQMPLIVNEMINKDDISTVISKARGKVINSLISNELDDNLGFEGHGPELTIMRSALIVTGVYDGKKKLSTKELEDKNLENVLNLVEEFILDSSKTDGRSMAELYGILREPKHCIGVKKGMIPLLLSVIIHKYKKHIVFTRKGHELELTVSLLNDIDKNPMDYSIYLESWDKDKEAYIEALESLFTNSIEINEKEYNSFNYILRGMHRWFLYLPKYTKDFKKKYIGNGEFVDSERESIMLRNGLRGSRFNSREFLFDKLPRIFGYDNVSEEMVDQIRKIKEDCDTFIISTKELLCSEIVKVFAKTGDGSINSAFNKWYKGLHDVTKGKRFDNNAEIVMEATGYISHNHLEFVDQFSENITGFTIDDWDDEKLPLFIDNIKRFKTDIDNFDKNVGKEVENVEDEKTYRIMFFDDENKEQIITFSNKGYDSVQAETFYEELSGLLEDYSYNLDKNEMRQVMMEIFKEYC